jgi:hypothetical protein
MKLAAQLQEALMKLQGESVHDLQDAVVVTSKAAGSPEQTSVDHHPGAIGVPNKASESAE